jgi:hypothetical protein
MSEYQYYEFLALDKPLTPNQIEKVRRFSTRAEISATRFCNVYDWGAFKGDVDDFLAKYFDVHVYLANWGTRVFALSLPASLLDFSLAKQYATDGSCELTRKGDRVILTLTSQDEEGDWDSSGEEWMAQLTPLRDEILEGDLRVFYLAWLLGIQQELVDDETPEPPVPAGLQTLSASQKAFLEFMRIDRDLLKVAAQTSLPAATRRPDAAQFLKTLSPKERDDILLAILDGRSNEVSKNLRARLRKSLPAIAPQTSERNAGDLRNTAASITDDRRRAEAERRARQEARKNAEAAAARAQYLKALAARREETWQQIEQCIATKLPKNYEQAVTLLRDLRDLADISNDIPAFVRQFSALRKRHLSKPSLQERLKKARLES